MQNKLTKNSLYALTFHASFSSKTSRVSLVTEFSLKNLLNNSFTRNKTTVNVPMLGSGFFFLNWSLRVQNLTVAVLSEVTRCDRSQTRIQPNYISFQVVDPIPTATLNHLLTFWVWLKRTQCAESPTTQTHTHTRAQTCRNCMMAV